ncbi:hypothetical protein [Ktedonobacter racemifer]|uniref:Shikimate kinase n=1 Tax=Ktedonobacter racemifer DSM 44963 TaxID=485913 RepID=D6TVN5_KTERA|nr:hypothetical protein [Ktedonobacter racemifer]EFH84268.1 shikimate kinase [Ktedonobacter racemifer DSM 44963]
MAKICILGGPGSGKTTLAQDLARKLDIPHHDLDKIGWKRGNDMLAWVEDAAVIAEQSAWIAEGIYIISTDPLIYQADYIVLLEVPWLVAVWRVLRRHIAKTLRGTNPYPTKLLFNFMKNTRSYGIGNIESDPTVVEAVRMYREEDRASAGLASAEVLIKRLERCQKTIPLTAAFMRVYLEKHWERVFIIRNNVDRERLIALLVNE